VNEFLISANIWWCYGQELGVLFFDSRCRIVFVQMCILLYYWANKMMMMMMMMMMMLGRNPMAVYVDSRYRFSKTQMQFIFFAVPKRSQYDAQ